MRLLLLLILFSGCLTSRKADKRIEKIATKYPDAIINKADKLVALDTFDFTRWKAEADSIFNEFISKTDTIENMNNSDTINRYNEIIKHKVKYITLIRERVLQIPPVYRTDTAKILKLSREVTNVKKQSEKNKKLSWIYLGAALSLFALLLLFLITRFRK